MVRAVWTWGEMVKFSHTVFAMPFALMAAFLAGRSIEGRGMPYWGQLGLVVVCMVAARSVAMTFNRIIDAQIDARNPRTASRALPKGHLSMATAWGLLVIAAVTLGAGCLGFFVYYGNSIPVLLSGPILIYLCFYSLTKRFTRWSHLVLGSAIALSPVAAWLAVDPSSVGVTAMLLMIAVTFWIAGFDIIYALQDIDFDRNEGLYSLPSTVGAAKSLWVAKGLHFFTVLGLVAIGYVAELGVVYAAGVIAVFGLLLVEHSIISFSGLHRVNLAFFTMNGLVSVILAVTAIIDVFRLPPSNWGQST